MFATHLFYKEGTRPEQCFPYCEKENADQGGSDGQRGARLVTSLPEKVSCPYCQWAQIKDMYTTNPRFLKRHHFLIHFGIAPHFSRDGTGRLLCWKARCGEVNIYPQLCLGTRDEKEVTCVGCLSSLNREGCRPKPSLKERTLL